MQLAISFAPVLIRAEAQLLPPWTTLESSLVGRCVRKRSCLKRQLDHASCSPGFPEEIYLWWCCHST